MLKSGKHFVLKLEKCYKKIIIKCAQFWPFAECCITFTLVNKSTSKFKYHWIQLLATSCCVCVCVMVVGDASVSGADRTPLVLKGFLSDTRDINQTLFLQLIFDFLTSAQFLIQQDTPVTYPVYLCLCYYHGLVFQYQLKEIPYKITTQTFMLTLLWNFHAANQPQIDFSDLFSPDSNTGLMFSSKAKNPTYFLIMYMCVQPTVNCWRYNSCVSVCTASLKHSLWSSVPVQFAHRQSSWKAVQWLWVRKVTKQQSSCSY